MPSPKRKPPRNTRIHGDLTPWSEADLDRLSEVTPEDASAAKEFWRKKAPSKLKRIIDAKPKKTPRASFGSEG